MKTKQTMLDRWSSNINERRSIEEFWDWLCQTYGEVELLSINIEKALDRYHEIDKRQLEKERRALLDKLPTR